MWSGLGVDLVSRRAQQVWCNSGFQLGDWYLHLAFLLPPLQSLSPFGHHNGQTVLKGNSTLSYQKIGLKCTTSLHKAFIFKCVPSCPWHYWSVIEAGCYNLFSLCLPFFCSCGQLHSWNSIWQMPPGDGGKSCLLDNLSLKVCFNSVSCDGGCSLQLQSQLSGILRSEGQKNSKASARTKIRSLCWSSSISTGGCFAAAWLDQQHFILL